MATTKPTGINFQDYRTAAFDSARRRGRYYQQLSYKFDREHNWKAATAAQVEADRWFEVFEVMCDKAENPNPDEGVWQ